MKKVVQLLPILLILTTFQAWGQTRIAKPGERQAILTLPKSDLQVRQEMDTVLYPAAAAECGSFVTTYQVADVWGFIAGTNGYEDLEKAQRLVYTSNSPYTIEEVWGFFAIANIVDNGPLRMRVYQVDPTTGGPGELLGESEDIAVSDIQTDTLAVLPTIFPMADSVTLSDTAFFVSLDLSDLYDTRDTVALFMTNDTCGTGDDAWELFSDSVTWLSINDRNSWQLNANWAIAAVVSFGETTGIDDPFVAQKGLQIFPASPNPTNTWVELLFQLEAASVVNVEVYSADGRLLERHNLGQRLPGRHSMQLDVQAFPPGTYVYGIVTNEARLMSRFVVSH